MDERSISPDERRRIAELEALCAGLWAERPSARCYGHLRVRSGTRSRDVLLGTESVALRSGAMLVDWERAPLAEVFLHSKVGDDYELDIDAERQTGGVVLARALLRARPNAGRQELVEIDDGEVCLRRLDVGWSLGPSRLAQTVVLRDVEVRRRASSPVDVQLDAAQQAAVERPGSRSLLILGEAGFGKTTVALHRLAHLHRLAEAGGASFSALVLVPTRGLRRLLLALLERMHVNVGEAKAGRSVEVRTFAGWIAAQGRRAFADLPERDSVDTPLAASRFKRHPALRCVLPQIIAGTKAMREVEQGYRDDEVIRPREQLLHLFGDRELLEQVAAESGGALTARMIQQVVAHTKVQFSPTTEHAYAHVVEREKLVTVDGKPIDAGTPMQDAETIDVEDFPVLFALDRLRHRDQPEQLADPRRYDLIVLDEAQEFAPIELEVIGRACQVGGSICVAGDEHQQVDETTVFTSWADAMRELGQAESHERITLTESYRCPPAIEALARSLFDDRGATELAHDPALAFTEVAHELELVSLLIEALTRLRERDRLASVAVICRFAASARRLHGLLAKQLNCKLVVDGDFRFGPGVSVTCVDEVKGLEFDYVVLADADAANFPDTREARRALYVAMTRAMHRLWLLWSGRRSPLIAGEPPALPPG
ncbi:3'-5' exonuclease [Nannocystaceae bacterium ST9]